MNIKTRVAKDSDFNASAIGKPFIYINKGHKEYCVYLGKNRHGYMFHFASNKHYSLASLEHNHFHIATHTT